MRSQHTFAPEHAHTHTNTSTVLLFIAQSEHRGARVTRNETRAQHLYAQFGAVRICQFM